MFNARDPKWLDNRLKERAEDSKRKRIQRRDPKIVTIDAGKFASQISRLATTIIYSLEREGYRRKPTNSSLAVDTAVIVRQLCQTYDLLLFLNADERRHGDYSYRQSYSFVSLPLIRTMIDGFYNCTAMLDDPSRARVFRISGLFRVREKMRAEEARFGGLSEWKEFLRYKRESFQTAMSADQITEDDLDDTANKWLLLQSYLKSSPDCGHKQMLRKFTLGFWKEYSSISHSSFDGLLGIFPFIANDRVEREQKVHVEDAGERYIALHIGRAATLLLCLLTEIQNLYRFDGEARIDKRLAEAWLGILPIEEAKELYESRYRCLLRQGQNSESNS